MDNMVERVARTLEAQAIVTPLDPRKEWYEAMARAAIEAMREPTEAMVEAVTLADLDIYWGYHVDGRPGGPDDAYRVMIDAALAPVDTPSIQE